LRHCKTGFVALGAECYQLKFVMKERISCFLVNNENFVNVEKKFDKMAGRVLLSAKSCVAMATQPTRTYLAQLMNMKMHKTCDNCEQYNCYEKY
ncbi:hypothetical protein T10_2339, partial [Trichinella papuae]